MKGGKKKGVLGEEGGTDWRTGVWRAVGLKEGRRREKKRRVDVSS